MAQREASSGAGVTQLPFWRVVLASVLALVVFEILKPRDLSPGWQHVGGAASLYGTALAWWLISAWRRRLSVRDVMGESLRWKHVALASYVSLASLWVHLGWAAALALLGFADNSSAGQWFAEDSHVVLVTTLLVTGGLAPCAEEMLFRGQIFRRLLRYARPRSAAIFSSLLFGIVHLDPVGAAVLGLLMVALYTRSRSLWVPIVAHMLTNLLGVVGIWAETVLGGSLPVSLWALAALLPLGLPWLVWFLRRELRYLDQFAPRA